MRTLITAIAILSLAVPVHAQWGRSSKGRQRDTQKSGDESKLPPTTIPCKAFTKNERGNWYVKGPVTFAIGTVANETLQNLEIPPKFFTIGGVGLYEIIQKQCGAQPPAYWSTPSSAPMR